MQLVIPVDSKLDRTWLRNQLLFLGAFSSRGLITKSFESEPNLGATNNWLTDELHAIPA